MLDCLNEMLRPKYKGITFYCDNFGKYDFVFKVKILADYNEKDSDNPYIFNKKPLCRDSRVLKITISRKVHGIMQSITILDSYGILNDKLKDLGAKYEVEVVKGEFPHKFAAINRLFYIGEMPNKPYYSNELTDDEYKDLEKNIWDFKEESLDYLSKDLICLYLILVKVNKTLFLDFDVKMSNYPTISKLAFEIFTRDYLNGSIPVVNKKPIYNDLKLGYYGGMAEVYKPYGENLYYYDVNFLYPYVSLNDMVGLECEKEYYTKKVNFKDLNKKDVFGFFIVM